MSWKKYKEEKPHKSEYYLVIEKDCTPTVLYYSKSYDIWEYETNTNVVFWHELPFPPTDD